MAEPSLFKHYQFVHNSDGANVEVVRNDEQVAVLAFDTQRLQFVHCHVLLGEGAELKEVRDKAQALREAGHPLLAQLLDVGEDEGNSYYITSHVDGEALDSYLARQQELPHWLAAQITHRSLEAVIALCEKGDFLPEGVTGSLRILQTGSQDVAVMVADYRLRPGGQKGRALRPALERQVKQLKSFLQERAAPQPGEQRVSGVEFAELLEGCLASAGTGLVVALRELRSFVAKLVPFHDAELATQQRPRLPLAPLLASYQEVARSLVNMVRIQSQRLDLANPYAMRGTLTKTGRAVSVEQVPPESLCGVRVREVDEVAAKAARGTHQSKLLGPALLHETEGRWCMAEEIVEGLSLADLLYERRSLNVSEAYLVLAALDSALEQVETEVPGLNRLRLEDIFVLTGYPREDRRSVKLIHTKLDEWPAFALMVRAYPTLGYLAGRGVDPSILLPDDVLEQSVEHPWHGGWLAAVARFLLGMEPLPGGQTSPQMGDARERETAARLFDEEVERCRKGAENKRADFLARFARLIHYHDQVKLLTPPAAPLAPSAGAPIPVSISTGAVRSRSPIGALAVVASPADRPAVGFAEALFRGTSDDHPGSPNWIKTAADAPPTIHDDEILLPPRDYVPLWLRAAVFVGGSMVLGALLAHVSGDAVWQKVRAAPRTVPKAIPVTEAGRSGAPATAAQVEQPSVAPRQLPTAAPDLPEVPRGAGLELKPPVRLRDLIAEPTEVPKAK